jgi:hypothetical protein
VLQDEDLREFLPGPTRPLFFFDGFAELEKHPPGPPRRGDFLAGNPVSAEGSRRVRVTSAEKLNFRLEFHLDGPPLRGREGDVWHGMLNVIPL